MSQSSGSRSTSADSASAIMSQSSEKRSISADSASKVSLATTNKDSTAITLLYEGNFDEWQCQISNMFIAKGRPTQAYPSIAHVNNETVTYHPSTFGDTHAILDLISPGVKARIPLDDLEAKASVLYAWLKKHCIPFRIFGLPPALRLKIYEEVVSSVYKDGDNSMPIVRKNGDLDCRRPALAQASQQLRQEVLPVYIALTDFYTDGWVDPLWLTDTLNLWGETWPGTSLQALKYFSLSVRAERLCAWDDSDGIRQERIADCEVNINVSFSDSKGLQIDQYNLQDLKSESRKRLNDLCAEVEAERKKNDGKGEAIVIYLERLCHMGNPDATNWLDLWVDD